MNARAYALLLTGIALVGCVLRFLFLTDGSIWLDESYTIERSAAPLSQLFRPSSYDANPPFSYLVYKGWTHLFGHSEWSYELPAAMVGIGAILATAFLGLRLWDRSASLIAALLVSVSVAHVDASQQIRSYSFGVLLAVWAVHSLCVLLDTQSRRAGAAFVATSLMLMYSHYVGVFVVASLLLFGLIHAGVREQKAIRPVVLASILVGLGFAPRLFDVYIQYTDFVSFNWIAPPSLNRALEVIQMFNSNSWAYLVCALVVASVAVVSSGARLFSGIHHVLFFWLLVPQLGVFALSLVGTSFFITRYFVFCLPAYALILARCIALLPHPIARAAAICLLLLTCVLPLRNYYSERLDTEGTKLAAQFVTDRFQKGDIILHTSFHLFLPTWSFYHEKMFPEYMMAESLYEEIAQFWPDKNIVKDKAFAQEYDRIWMYVKERRGQLPVTVPHAQNFPNFELKLAHQYKRSIVFLLQRCPSTGCDPRRKSRRSMR